MQYHTTTSSTKERNKYFALNYYSVHEPALLTLAQVPLININKPNPLYLPQTMGSLEQPRAWFYKPSLLCVILFTSLTPLGPLMRIWAYQTGPQTLSSSNLLLWSPENVHVKLILEILIFLIPYLQAYITINKSLGEDAFPWTIFVPDF